MDSIVDGNNAPGPPDIVMVNQDQENELDSVTAVLVQVPAPIKMEENTPDNLNSSVTTPKSAKVSKTCTAETDSNTTDKTDQQPSTSAEPKIIKKGHQVITSYVDEKTGKIAAYEPGMKLEVSDFAGTWYPAKVVEIDNAENEILVHFEHWSSRFDEWIKMDSNRLRPTPNTNVVKTTFEVGEHVEALWGMDGQRYSGEILTILPNDYYQVLFDDGIRYKKKYNQIFKLKKTRRGSGRLSTDTPSTPPTTNPKIARPLPKLTPAPFLLQNSDNGYSQQPVTSLPPNVPLLANVGPAVGRRMSFMSHTPPPMRYHDHNEEDQQSVSLAPLKETPALTPKPHFSVFAPITTELGKRKRTITDYSQLLKTPILKQSPTSSNSDTGVTKNRRRKTPSKPAIDNKELLQGSSTKSSYNESPGNDKANQNRKSVTGIEESAYSVQEEIKPVSKRRSNAGVSIPKVDTGMKHEIDDQSKIGKINQTDKSETSSSSLPPPLEQNSSESKPNAPLSQSTTLVGGSDSPVTLTKRKRTIHDYSMLLKTRVPRLSLPSSGESDSPPKTRQRRRKTLSLREHEFEAESLPPVEIAEERVKSPDVTVSKPAILQQTIPDSKDAKESTVSIDAVLEKVSDKPEVEVKKHKSPVEKHSAENVKRTSIPKQPPTLTEFDMFAPKKKNLHRPFRSSVVNDTPPLEKTNQEISPKANNSQPQATVNKDLPKPKPTLPVHKPSLPSQTESDEEELLDIPEYELRTDKKPEENLKQDKQVEEEVNPTFIRLRKPGRPFKKNRPPPGHWSYNAPTSTSTPATNGNSYLSPTYKVGPTTNSGARHSMSRFMKSLKIPLVPINMDRKSTGVLRGLSNRKVERLQRKLLECGAKCRLDIDPNIKDVSVDVINCSCGLDDEHGFMIQCEFCQCWQHGNCFGYTEDSGMPSHYVCDSCCFPFHARDSMKNEWNQEFKRKGRLPRLSLQFPRNIEIENEVLNSTELQDRLYQVLDIIHSNRVKLHIANKVPEHPKIYQWDKPSLSSHDDLKMRMYNKVYKPILRRLLYINRHDPNYQDKLVKMVEKRFNKDQEAGTKPTNGTEATTPSNDNISLEQDVEESMDLKISPEPKETNALSNEAEVSLLMNDLMVQVDNIVTAEKEIEQSQQQCKLSRPTELSILKDNIAETVEKPIASSNNEIEKKNQTTTPLAEDLSVLGNIDELSTKVDPDIDDLFLSIFNDPDFEKSFDAPLNANGSALKNTSAPASKSSIIVPTLARITPELCRENLINHVTDQQDLVDKCLRLLEDKIELMEKGRMRGMPPTYTDGLKLFKLQMSVKRILAVLELLKGLPRNHQSSYTYHQQPSGVENDPNHGSSPIFANGENDR